VTATVTIRDAAKLGDALELGLLCTEYYDVKQEVYTQNGSHEQRGSTSWGVHARADRRGIDFHAWHPFALAEA
jgi:hypothetical protein